MSLQSKEDPTKKTPQEASTGVRLRVIPVSDSEEDFLLDTWDDWMGSDSDTEDELRHYTHSYKSCTVFPRSDAALE